MLPVTSSCWACVAWFGTKPHAPRSLYRQCLTEVLRTFQTLLDKQRRVCYTDFLGFQYMASYPQQRYNMNDSVQADSTYSRLSPNAPHAKPGSIPVPAPHAKSPRLFSAPLPPAKSSGTTSCALSMRSH